MKRSGPLRRTTPLKAKKALERGEALLRRTPLRSKPKPQVSERERRAMEQFGVVSPRECCAVCGRTKIEAWAAGTKLEAHHVISKQKLKQVCSARALDVVEVVWDRRNRMCLCGQPCHADHTTAKRRVRRSKLTATHYEFAAEYGLTYVIEREYPDG